MKFVLTEINEGSIQNQVEFNSFEDLKSHLVETDYFSWINENEPEKEIPDFTTVATVREINSILDDYDYSWWTLKLEVIK